MTKEGLKKLKLPFNINSFLQNIYSISVRVLLLGLFFHVACKDQVYNPKPRTYPRVVIPEKKYYHQQANDCPFEFSIPVYSVYEKDSTFFDTLAGPCWFNINYKELHASLYCTYTGINNNKDLSQCINDSYKLIKGHLVKAEYIDEIPIAPSKNVKGMLYEIEGPAATPFQFYVTDSTNHFLRGALYFNTHINYDSLKPYYDFIKEDVVEMLRTLQWK